MKEWKLERDESGCALYLSINENYSMKVEKSAGGDKS